MTIKDSNRDILVSNLMELLREYSTVQNSYDSSVNYVTSAGLDSFDIMNYVSEIELKYQISFESIELSNEFSHTVDGLASLLFEKLKAK